MKTFLLITLVSLASCQLNAKSKHDKIVELLEIMQSEKMIDKTFSNMIEVFKNQPGEELNKEQEEELLVFSMNEMKAIAKKAIEEDYPAIYDKYFSEKEIDELINFYQSSAGQKYLKAMPEIQKDFMQVMMRKYMPEFKKKMEEKKKEIKGE